MARNFFCWIASPAARNDVTFSHTVIARSEAFFSSFRAILRASRRRSGDTESTRLTAPRRMTFPYMTRIVMRRRDACGPMSMPLPSFQQVTGFPVIPA